MTLSAPQPLGPAHELDAFDCGVPALDQWLRRRAVGNQASGASRTFAVCDGQRVVAYYALAAGAVATMHAAGRIRRNMPDPIPMAVLGRLAIDRSLQGRGIGRALVRDAVMRTLQAAEAIAIRGLLVHALSDDAKAFYVTLGFEVSPLDPLLLMATLGDLRKGLELT